MLRKLLVIITSLVLLVVASIYIASLVDKIGLHKVEIVSYPGDAKVSINGAPSTGVKKFYLESGTYTATLTREGFAPEYIRIDTSTSSDYPVLASLLAQSDEAKQWEEDNQPERQRFETLAASLLNQQGDDQREKYPILKYLPSKTNLYSIGYITNDDRSIVVTVHAPDVYVPYAINQIERWDLDPEDYEIDFVNQRNIFEDEQ